MDIIINNKEEFDNLWKVLNDINKDERDWCLNVYKTQKLPFRFFFYFWNGKLRTNWCNGWVIKTCGKCLQCDDNKDLCTDLEEFKLWVEAAKFDLL